MARTCGKCGAVVGDNARFCGKCGEVLQATVPVNPPSNEQIPSWSGWDIPAQAGPASRPTQGKQTTAVRFSKPAAPPKATAATVPTAPPKYQAPTYQASVAPQVASYQASAAPAPQTQNMPLNNAPQYWESYDYQGSQVGQTQAYSPSGVPTFEPRGDASRPLPKLDDVLGARGTSYNPSDTGERLEFDDLDDDIETKRAKAYDSVTTFSLWCAGLVLFPMPFVDLVFLVPIQSAMVVAISKIYGVKQSPEKTVAVLAGACGMTVFGQFTTLFLANWLPIVGKLLSAPFVFGWTYGMGEVAIRYFESKGTASKDELKQIFKKASKEASKNYDSSKVNPQEALENIRGFVSEDEYRKIRERFGPRHS